MIETLIGKTWEQLTQEEKIALAAMFGTSLGVAVQRPFTQEERDILAYLFLDVSDQLAAIEAITNQYNPVTQLVPCQTIGGLQVIPAAILTDPVSYAPYLEIFTNAPLVQLQASDFISGEEP